MRKIFLTISGLVLFSLALAFPLSLSAATLTFNAETTLSLPNGISLKVLNGGLVASLVVNDDSTISLTFESDSAITIRSEDVYQLISSAGTATCVAGSYNEIKFTKTSGSGTLSATTDTACIADVTGGGGGGGGGGGLPPAAPTDTSILINSDNAQTDSVNITLDLSATDAATMLIANEADFSDAGSFETYATTKSWTLTSDLGTKTVYVKFRSSAGGESSAVNDTIELVAVIEPTTGDVTADSGGSVSLSDNKASVDVPAGAVSGTGTISITPTSSYTAPTGDKTVVGNRVYDFSIKVGEEEVTTFLDFITLTFTYTDEEIAGLDESTLGIYIWNETTQSWDSFGGAVDTENNTVTRKTANFSTFALLGEPVVTAGTTGDLIKLACDADSGINDPCRAVYYLGNDGKRYVFPNEKTYKTWYDDFSTVKVVGAEELASYQIGGNVTYRPGVKLVKIQTDAKVYAVAGNGTLRWVSTGVIAEGLYGASWSSQIDDIPDAFFVNYTVGSDLNVISDYSVDDMKSASPDINTDKGL